MILFCPRLIAVACFAVLGLSVPAGAAEPPIIAKARARLAPDSALDAVRSIHYIGTLDGADPADPGKQIHSSIEIFLRKPAQQRIVVTAPSMIEISALDDYEAWRRTIDPEHPEHWEQTQMDVEQVKLLRADVWQNLAFFRGIEALHGWIEDEGPTTIDGVACEKIAFHHSDSLVYLRYFDPTTGQLVYTGTAESNVREEGELIAGGIRFPKRLIMSQMIDGRPVVRRLTFDKITVNEDLPDSLFSVPLPTVK